MDTNTLLFMKKRTYWKNRHGYLWGVILAMVALCFTGCKDDDNEAGVAFDPHKPVTITKFEPEEATYGSNLILYGDNFGNDPSKIKLIIGGKNAKIISVKGQSLYTVVPQKVSKKGDIHISILGDNGDIIASTEAEKAFTYKKSWLVSTHIGTHYEDNNYFKETDGPFDECGGFNNFVWFSFDPASNFDRMYVTKEGKLLRVIDFEADNGKGGKGMVSTFDSKVGKVSVMTWTLPPNQDMILCDNVSDDSKTGPYLYTRSSGYTERKALVNARGVNGVMTHPKNGELYYSRYRAGDVRQYNYETGKDIMAFKNPYDGVGVYLNPHPEGKFAYLLEQEKYYIARSDYDPIGKIFTTPYTICGQPDSWAWVDGIGTEARLNRPVQGVFVKNPDYEGNEDEYDFYFCDKNNHCIRILTPEGRVTTFAGRGNNKESGYVDGELRRQALFNEPIAIAYDEKRKCFYVGDRNNKVIRKIEKESDVEEETENESGEEVKK